MIDALHVFRSLTAGAGKGWLIGIASGSVAALVIAPLIVAVKLESRDREAWRAGQFALPPGTP